jgi:hypothetical protein
MVTREASASAHGLLKGGVWGCTQVYELANNTAAKVYRMHHTLPGVFVLQTVVHVCFLVRGFFAVGKCSTADVLP